MHPAKGLKAWEAANLLADEVRATVERFPRGRAYRLRNQLTAAADSISANIAEGSAGQSIPERLRFYRSGLASAQETITFIKRARAASLMGQRTYFRLTNRANVTHSLTSALIRRLERDNARYRRSP